MGRAVDPGCAWAEKRGDRLSGRQRRCAARLTSVLVVAAATAAIPATTAALRRRGRSTRLRRGARGHLWARRRGGPCHLWRAGLERRTVRLRRRTHPAATEARRLRPWRDRQRLRTRRLEALPFAAAIEARLRAWCCDPRFRARRGQLWASRTAADLRLRAWRHDARLRRGLRPEARPVAGRRAIAAHAC